MQMTCYLHDICRATENNQCSILIKETQDLRSFFKNCPSLAVSQGSSNAGKLLVTYVFNGFNFLKHKL